MLTSLWGGCPQDLGKDSALSPLRIDAITPDHGPTTGGTRVTIRGGPFQDNVGVLFGAFAGVDPVIVNSRMITVQTPAQDAGVVNVSVLTDLGFVNVLGAFTYEAVPAPGAEHIFPASGPESGGTEVTITGENFTAQTTVLFDQSPATNVRLVTSQILSVATPPHAVGPVDVTLMNGNEQQVLDNGFTYESLAPSIDSLEPASGPIAGGTTVTIRGSNLPTTATIIIGGVNVPATFLNSSVMTFVTPSVDAPALVAVSFLLENGVDQLPAGDFEYTSEVPYDDGTDTDGDGITDVQEQIGWEIWTELFGLQLGVDTFGNVTRYSVTSDPTVADTDGDGINDNVEMLIRSDPRKPDTDDDGLWDGEEWNQWLTSPTGVDTDADSRGRRDLQNAPNQALFDGLEIFDAAVMRLPQGHELRVVRPRATSPTLADTDGDGGNDFDEYDSTVRNGVLSDLPRLEYELVGDVDVRLNVQYAESIGQTKEYGVTLTEAQTDTVASSYSSTVGWSVEIGVEFGYAGASAHVLGHVNAGVHGEYTWTNSTETARMSSEEHSRLQSDSREFTETAANGAIRTAILLSNPGNTTFTLNGLGVLVSQREKRKAPGDTSPQTPIRTIATMTPVFDTFTLAPGETAGPFELAATDVNAQLIKELLANPDTLILGTAAMNFTDSSGLDFDFVRQFTVAQTANIVIDFGDGQVRNYNIATNVDRNPDSSYRGIKLRRVFEEMLRLPYGDPINGYTTMAEPSSGRQVLQSLLGREFATGSAGARRNFWAMVTNNEAHLTVDLNDLALRAGDTLHLFFSRDDDDDGLVNTLETAAGTDQDPLSPADADGDGLTDKFEVIDGWIAFENPADPNAPHPDGIEKRRVFSSATSADSDADELTDAEELAARSDPLDPDSDGDGILDGVDPFPIRRAGIRFVKAGSPAGGDGRSWATAFATIQQAVAAATTGLSTPANPDDDVAQIWVARGIYKPSGGPIILERNVGMYGGFSGPAEGFAGETKRGQRNSDAASNGCVISGDINNNDVGGPTPLDGTVSGPLSRIDNAQTLVRNADFATSSTILDGFTLTASAGQAAMNIFDGTVIRNCIVSRNGAMLGAGVLVNGGTPEFHNCVIAANVANSGGGLRTSSGRARFFDCTFEQNEARHVTSDEFQPNGGAVYIGGNARPEFVRCSFVGNQAFNWGAGIHVNEPSAYVLVDSCRFFSNLITRGNSGGEYRGAGAGMFLMGGAAVHNSVFWENRSENHGGGIMVFAPVSVTNCTFAANRTLDQDGGGGGVSSGTTVHRNPSLSGSLTMENTILWNNWNGDGELPNDPNYEEHHQISRQNDGTVTVRNSCFNRVNQFAGNNNFGTDPKLMAIETGDLRLEPESPCIDRGNSFVDVEPLTPGLQRPEFDFFGNARIIDGNGDGFQAIDIGACESLPHQQP